ncbi:MAG: transcription termination factor Rho [Clostridia bacterium]|nr:transcription termination factor Rho [Clostridia bacterium]
MPTSSLTGKSKDDLATIAAVSGLLSREQAMTMTKPELMKFLKNAESAAKSNPKTITESTPKPAGRTARKTSPDAPAAPRKVAARKKPAAQEHPAVSEEAPVLAVAEPASAPAPVHAKTPAPDPEMIGDSEAPAKIRKTRQKPVAKKGLASAAADSEIAPSQVDEFTQEMPSVVKQQSERQATPKAQPKAEPLTDQPAVVQAKEPVKRSFEAGTIAKRPAPGKGKYPDRYPAKNQPFARSQDRNQKRPSGKGKAKAETAVENNRPMRVKVFGIPANPLAGHDAELEPETIPTLLPEVTRVPEESRVPSFQPGFESVADTLPTSAEESTQDQAFSEKEPVTTAAGDKFNRKQQIESGESITGVLEVMPDGYGFLRRDNYLQGAKDAYVPPQYIRRFNLRPGDLVTGPCKKQRDNDRYQALLYIKEVNGQAPDKMIRRPQFDRLTPIYPDERYVLETVRNELSTRIIDLVAPIGKGQRGMIVSPPKAGKTILLQKIANAISTNNPDVKLIVLLIDERPEEVTDMQRSINGEVVFSTFDKTPENHVKVTELVLERAMRLVELKQDVVILLDSMTRLARAYNLTITPTGRTLSGGLDPGALYGPKRFFGAARNIENGGSLTIIATSLIETGSRMDEVIFEEFKGTGNMEVYLDRKLSEKRIFPAIDINRSGTRREELLLSDKELDAVWTIRKAFGQLDTAAVTETIINLLLKTQNNQQFISSINVSFNDKNVFDAMRGTRPSQTNGNTQTPGGQGTGRRNFDRDND